MRYVWILVIVIFFGGCTKYVETNVSVFHELRSSVAGITYAIVPGAEQANSLEFQAYADMLKTELNQQGMIEAPRSKASYAISMSYGMDGGKQVFSSSPVYGQTGIMGSFSTGTVITRGDSATFTGARFYTPMYGIVGSETRSDMVFTRFLTIDIVDMSNGQTHKVYEAKALSIGETGMLVSVIPAMIKSVFENFPGVSGTTRTSKQPLAVEQK